MNISRRKFINIYPRLRGFLWKMAVLRDGSVEENFLFYLTVVNFASGFCGIELIKILTGLKR